MNFPCAGLAHIESGMTNGGITMRGLINCPTFRGAGQNGHKGAIPAGSLIFLPVFYSALMFPSFTTRAHLIVSAEMNLPKSAEAR